MTKGETSDESDHPRSCGANVVAALSNRNACGSSPLVRGQPLGLTGSNAQTRIIPARAGPTSAELGSLLRFSDHPRSCGANHFSYKERYDMDGSSPLVRGQPGFTDSMRANVRIIPARAGPTTRNMLYYFLLTDHPRSCGANSSNCATCFHVFGSSPLVRGQLSVTFNALY